MSVCASRGEHRNHDGRFFGQLSRALLAAALAVVAPATLGAAECPAQRQPRIPPSEQPVINIDKHKDQLFKYQREGTYIDDIALVIGDARAHVERRAGEVKWPAVVLDIDETSLSNWPNLKANNFGFIKGGPCFEEPGLACGFDDWILKASAPAIAPTLDFFKAIRDKNIAVFFITGRRQSQRQATMWNLDRAGYQGWAWLSTRSDDDHRDSIVPFKSGERKSIEQKGYTIIANVGDQQSDLDEGAAECAFKLPNPFYFIR